MARLMVYPFVPWNGSRSDFKKPHECTKKNSSELIVAVREIVEFGKRLLSRWDRETCTVFEQMFGPQ